jgi:CHAT domain-containing protein
MKHRFLIAFLVLTTFNQLNAQKWHQYSDSILVFFQKSDLKNTTRYLKLAEEDLKSSSIVEDTIYADFLYRKGVAYSLNNQNYEIKDLLKSLEIWKKSSSKNHFKIFKLNHFIGYYYFLNSLKSKSIDDYRLIREYFAENVRISKKYSYTYHLFYRTELYLLAYLENDIFKNKRNVKNYVEEYTKVYSLSDAVKNKDLNYQYMLEYIGDYQSQEKLLYDLIDYLKTSNPVDNEFLITTYSRLLMIIGRKEVYQSNSNSIIKYGESAYEIWRTNKLNSSVELNASLKVIFSFLSRAYINLNDEINYEKFKKLNESIRSQNPENDEIEPLDSLKLLLERTDFKSTFKSYEEKMKSEQNFSELIKLYQFSITLFEQHKHFDIPEIRQQLDFLYLNENKISGDDLVQFDILFSEYYLLNNDFDKLLKISNKYLNSRDFEVKIKFIQLKALSSMMLGNLDESKKYYQIGISLVKEKFGEKDLRLLNFLTGKIDSDLFNIDPQSVVNVRQIIELIYENKLQDNFNSVGAWISIGNKALGNFNYDDALFYFQKAINILDDNKGKQFNDFYYLSAAQKLVLVYLNQNKFDQAKNQLDFLYKFISNTKSFGPIIYGEYYAVLAQYYFYIDDYKKTIENLDIAYSYLGKKIGKLYSLPYIFSNYLIDNNYQKVIKSLEDYQKNVRGSNGLTSIYYHLKYSHGEKQEAKVILINQINSLIQNNNQSFHLMSDFQREALYRRFSMQFELLNGYLLDSDENFLKQYIDFRFYSKALLLNNSFKNNSFDINDNNLIDLWKANKLKLDYLIESNFNVIDSIKVLEIKNREIEQILLSKSKYRKTPTLQDLKLKNDEAYVEIIRINKQSINIKKKGADLIDMFSDTLVYGAIIINNKNQPKFIIVDSSNKLESIYANEFVSNISEKKSDNLSFGRMFKAIEDQLEGVKTLYIVTDGIFNKINFEALYNPTRKQYLIEYYNIHLIPSVNSILEKSDENVPLNPKMAIFGSPQFLIKEKFDNNSVVKLSENIPFRTLSNNFGGIQLGYLKGAEQEINSINTIMQHQKFDVNIFKGNEANETNFKNLNSPYILHIATHGYFNSNSENSSKKSDFSIKDFISSKFINSRIVNSGLFLSGAQNTINGTELRMPDNGILTAEEVKGVDLNKTELVILSACETGLGDNIVGEGVSGLQRSFLIAGTKKVIMSLWKVNDTSTQLLMTRFYENWLVKKMNIYESLKQAKLIIKQNFSNPLDWAGFVLLE